MANSIPDTGSLLAIDVGSVTTRAMLFDIVDNRYRYLASGESRTTDGDPYFNVSEGIRIALDHLQRICGRRFIGADEQLIIPSKIDGTGVDSFAATFSVGTPVNVVAVGLLEEISVESAIGLAESISSKIRGVISLNDHVKTEARVNLIVGSKPDLVIAAGGIEKGASHAVRKLLDAVGLACYLLPTDERPEILFAGNQEIKPELISSLENIATIHYAPNIRPELDVEQIEPAKDFLSSLVVHINERRIPGVSELNAWANGGLLPTPTAFSRVIKFLSEAHPSTKGVLGVDIGASAITLSAAFAGKLAHGVYPQFGLGSELGSMLEKADMRDINRWLMYDTPDQQVHEYLVNKAMYPSALPVTLEELDLEQAIARQSMRNALQIIARRWPENAHFSRPGLLPWVEPILASGSIFSKSPGTAQTVLMLLDGLQPTGVTTLILDQNHIAPVLGAAAAINPLLAVQVMDTSSFSHLGTVISPVGNVHPGTPVLRLRVEYSNGRESSHEVKQGALDVLPLPYGQSAKIQLQPLQKCDVGMGAPGRGGSLRVSGGLLGVIIDARGRPLSYPVERSRRRELVKKWLWTLGGR